MKLATLCYVKDKQKNKTLMMHRIKKQDDMHKNKWNGLGGKFNPGESPEECAIREVKEESGLDVESLCLKGVITFPMFDGKDDWYVYIFVIDEFSGELINCDEGELAWIDSNKVKDLNIWEGDKIFLTWLEQEKFFSAKFIYKDKKLEKFNVSFY